ncbi:MAG: glycosyltransferase family 4 protein [bacterium]|nr:glycosyltransferase family 4 protein [bacterium]
MTILQLNKFFYPKGGADVVMLELTKLLESNGHTVIPFAMQDARNVLTPYEHSFVSPVETEAVRIGWQGMRTAGRMLYSLEARRKLAGLIRTTKPEIAHIHNIYQQISPSVLGTLRRNKIPTVMTVHDFALLSPNYTLFDHGAICERGIEHPWQVVKHKCIKNSAIASALAATVFFIHKKLKLYERGIDRFIAPTQFVKEMLVQNGFREDRIAVLPHFYDASHVIPSYVGSYVGYVGRLSPEKGVGVLIRAAALAPNILVRIAGTGPDAAKLMAYVEEQSIKNVEFVGRLDGEALQQFYTNASLLVVPSIWYEVFGRVVLEAYAAGKPVIASNIGGLPEVVKEGETGILVPPGDAAALAERIQSLFRNADLIRKMGESARRVVEQEYAPAVLYPKMLEIYEQTMKV